MASLAALLGVDIQPFVNPVATVNELMLPSQ